MRVFLTGATGFIGSRIVPELQAAGHQVVGLTRSQDGSRALASVGVTPHLGDILDLDSLRTGAAGADAVIHTAFDHDFTTYAANCEKDRLAIQAVGGALSGTDRPLIISSATMMGSTGEGRIATEDVLNLDQPIPRVASEQAAEALKAAGLDVRVVRLPQVHDTVRQGLISTFVDIARAKGVSAYVGEGMNRWSAGHVLDVARLYRLALDRGELNARYHAVAEEGVAARDIAEAIGAGLKVPVVRLSAQDAASHFGWLAMFADRDTTASSARTRAVMDWIPEGPGLIEDLRAMDYDR